ncbi:MAG: NAD(P)-binding protein [Candidatus Levybacteria bacterium]|nr:NAD(P)-binding protein [Candidatus Levybacteria bacterium]
MEVKDKKIIILGAGLTGLSTSYFLKKKGIMSMIIEKENHIGGLCSSIKIKGFTFERVQHFVHLRYDKTRLFIENELKIPLNRYDRKAFIYFKKKLVPYPFQANLFALPLLDRLNCITTFIKTKFFNKENIKIKRYSSYYEWCHKNLGKGISERFMIPYNEKVWGISSRNLTTDWMGRLVPYPNAQEILLGACKNQKGKFGYNPIFYYPKNESIEILSKGLAFNNIKNAQAVTNINFNTKIVRTSDGSTYSYDLLINTIPLPECVSLIENCPKPIQKSALLLNHTGIYVLNLGIKTNEFVKRLNWCYFPEKEFDFYRLGIASNTSSKLSPKGFSTCYIEFNEQVFKENTKNRIYVKTVNQLVQLGFINKKEDVVCKKFIYIPYAYVIFDKNHQTSTEKIMTYFKKKGIYSIGRFGAWEYSYIEKNITDAQEISEIINNKILSKPIFRKH